MRPGKGSAIFFGIGMLILIVIMWEYVMPAYQDITQVAIDRAGLTSGFEYLVFKYLPWWILLCGLGAAIWKMIKPARQ